MPGQQDCPQHWGRTHPAPALPAAETPSMVSPKPHPFPGEWNISLLCRVPQYFLSHLHLQHLSCFSFSWGKNTDGFWFCLEGLDLSVIPCIFSDVNISWHLRYLEPVEVIYFQCLVSGELSVHRNIYLLRMDELLPSRNSQKRTSFSYCKPCYEFCLGENILVLYQIVDVFSPTPFTMLRLPELSGGCVS